MLDKNFIRRKIKLIHEDLRRLEKLSKYSLSEITADFVKMGAVERLLEKIIMRAIDINQHLIAELGKGTERIRGYEDTFHTLAELGVYPKNFAQKIAPSAGLRNRLVHEYNDTQEEIICQSIPQAINQYAEYCRYIINSLAAKTTHSPPSRKERKNSKSR